MAERVDGSIVVDVDLDAEGFRAGSAKLQNAVKSFSTQAEKLGPAFQKAMSGNMSSIAAFNGKAQLLESTMANIRKEMLASADNMAATGESEALVSAAEKAEQEQVKLQKTIEATEDKLEKAKAGAQGYYDEVAKAQASTDEMLKSADTGEQVDRVLELEKHELEQIEAKYASQLGKVKELTASLDDQKKRLAELPSIADKFRAQAEKAMNPFSQTEWYRQFSQELEKAVPQLAEIKEQVKETEGAFKQADLVKSFGLDKAESTIARLKTQMERLQFKGTAPDSSKWKDLQFNILQAEKQLGEYGHKAASLHDAEDLGDEVYQKISEQIAQANAQLRGMSAQIEATMAAAVEYLQEMPGDVAQLRNEMQQANSAWAQMPTLSGYISNAFQSVAGKARSAFSTIGTAVRHPLQATDRVLGSLTQKAGHLVATMANIAKFSANKLVSGIKSAASGLARMASHSRDTSRGMGGILDAVKRLAPAMLAAQGVMGILRKAVNAYMQENQQLSNTMNACWSSIGNMLGPIIERLVNLVAMASAYFTQFLQLLGLVGKGTSSAISAAGGAASKDAKELKRQLASFDELNILSDSGSDGGGGGGGGAGDMNAALPQVELPDWAKLMVDQLKAGNWAAAATTLAKQLNIMVGSVDWAGIGNKIGYYLNGALTFLATFITTFDWMGLGADLASGVNSILSRVNWTNLGTVLAGKFRIILLTAAGFLQNLDWSALAKGFSDFATGFFDGIADAISQVDWGQIARNISTFLQETDWSGIGVSIGNCINEEIKALGAFIRDLDWWALGTSLADSFMGIWNSIDWAGAAQSLSDGFIGLFNSITAFIAGIDWQQLGRDVAAFIAAIDYGGIADALFEALGAALGGIEAFLGGLLAEAFTGIGDYFSEEIEACGGDIVAGIFKGIIDAIAGIGEWIYNHISLPFINGFKEAFGIHSPSTVMAEQGDFIIQGLLQGITAAWHSIVEFFSGKLSGIGETISNTWSNVKTWTASAWSNVKNTVGSAWNSMKSTASSIGSNIASKVSDTYTNVKDYITDKLTSAGDKASSAWESMKSTATSVGSSIASKASSAFTQMKSSITEKVNSAKTVATTGWNSMKTAITSAATSMGSTVSSKFSGIYSTVTSKISSATSTIKTGFENARSSIVSKMQSAMNTISGQNWRSVGSNICSGISNGINAGWTGLKNTIGNMASNLLSSAKSALGIHSPSVLFKKIIGLNIGYGIGEGITDSQPSILKTVTGVADAIAEGFQKEDYAISPISVDKSTGLPNALNGFSDTITDSFTMLLDRLEAIAQRVTFTMPAVAGSVVPYQVASAGAAKGNDVSESITASNEELGSVVVQVVSQAAAAIVRAIEENSGGSTSLDRAQLLRAVKEDLSRETKMRGRSPLPV